MDISGEAREYIKKTKNNLIEKIAGRDEYKAQGIPVSFFMAGSPGAGKTEFSRSIIEVLGMPMVRIDADEIREDIPGYDGGNAELFQSACIKGVEILYDHVNKKKLNAIVDGTFASYEVAHKNIKRALDKNRKVAIFYIYQKPEDAWRFTVSREKEDRRHITKDIFINAFFKARENVNKIKEDFGKDVSIFFIEKNFNHGIEKFEINVDDIDKFIKIKYTPQMLEKLLK
ncbi:zeta toxin family protein [Patescibacteria group bacterium]